MLAFFQSFIVKSLKVQTKRKVVQIELGLMRVKQNFFLKVSAKFAEIE